MTEWKYSSDLGNAITCQCRKCGAICVIGGINPKTQLCTECDKEYEPAEWWWMDWKLKKKEKRGEETSEEEKDMDAYVLMEMVYQHRIFISPSVVEIPFHLEDHPKFKELIAKRDTQTYESTYSFICPGCCPKDEIKANKELVWKFFEKHPGGWSVSNEKIEKRSKLKK